VRAHYLERLQHSDRADVTATHTRIKDYYLALAGDTPTYPTLNDLQPLIEVVHHLCQAGAYDEAEQIRWERISQRDRYVLIHQLGAYETQLAIMLEFFPDGDTAQDPAVSDANDKRFILNEIGLCLMSLGRLSAAVPFYERAVAGYVAAEDWHNASIGYQNLAGLHAHLGALAASADAAAEALTLARRAQDKRTELSSLAYQAWAAHLRGEAEAARTAFAQAEALEREITPQVRYLYSNRGIFHANHLRRMGEADYARAVTEANLKICEEYHWPDKVSMSHRVIGDLDADAGQPESAGAHYDAALKIARGISMRDILIEALLERGRFYARYAGHLQDPASARSDLNEALGYALAGGYRVYECDIRIGLAWAALAAKEATTAQAEADRAAQLAAEIGYHWGAVDAAEVMGVIGERG
jgi:tetratricopeptide (TPR) repeat protein